MRHLALAGLFFAASISWANEPTSNVEQLLSQAQSQAPAPAQSATITVPAGTRIPMSLTSPITNKSRRGDSVRAVTAFPVTVDTRLAIPAGTYVEGVIDKVNARATSTPTVQMHFTSMLFNNGYSVTFAGTNTVAELVDPGETAPGQFAFTSESEPVYALAQQQGPGLPPLHHPGPSVGTIAGIGLGVGAAVVITAVILGRRHGGTGGVVFDTGWQFEMVLQSPLTLDAARATAGVASPSAQ